MCLYLFLFQCFFSLDAGLPRLLVDVRHEASHNEMPALPLLRLAAAQALDWLHTAYWQRQEAHLQAQHQKVIALLKASPLSPVPVCGQLRSCLQKSSCAHH